MLYLIVNPIAGNTKAKTTAPIIEKILRELCIDYRLIYTLYPGHATEIGLEAVEKGIERVIAVGGDGTVREVAKALRGSETILGIIPAGTGNDFSKTFGIPTDISQATLTAAEGRAINVDISNSGDNMFINIASVGFDAQVAETTERFKAKYSGMKAYLAGMFSSLKNMKYITLDVSIDNGPFVRMKLLILAIANGQYYGGGFHCMPISDPTDGYLDIMLVDTISRIRLLTLLPKYIKGKHFNKKCIKLKKCKSITLRAAEGDLVLNLDGEVLRSPLAEFSVSHGALRLSVPESFR